MSHRPWLFEIALLPLKPFNGCTLASKMDFSRESLWVHMHDLPIVCMNKEIGTFIGNTIEKAQWLCGSDVCDMGHSTNWAKPTNEEALSKILQLLKPMDLGLDVHLAVSPHQSNKSLDLQKSLHTNKKWKRVACQGGLNLEMKLASRKRIVEVILTISPLSNQKKNRHLFEVSDEIFFTSHANLAVVASQPC